MGAGCAAAHAQAQAVIQAGRQLAAVQAAVKLQGRRGGRYGCVEARARTGTGGYSAARAAWAARRTCKSSRRPTPGSSTSRSRSSSPRLPIAARRCWAARGR